MHDICVQKLEYMKTKLHMIFITKSMDSKFVMLEKGAQVK
jgi:hypothetical protein